MRRLAALFEQARAFLSGDGQVRTALAELRAAVAALPAGRLPERAEVARVAAASTLLLGLMMLGDEPVCMRCGAPFEAGGSCSRRAEGCQGGRGESPSCAACGAPATGARKVKRPHVGGGEWVYCCSFKCMLEVERKMHGMDPPVPRRSS